MRYIQPTFTLPTSTGKLTQTDWEIAVGLRNPDGTLVGAPVQVGDCPFCGREVRIGRPCPHEGCKALYGVAKNVRFKK